MGVAAGIMSISQFMVCYKYFRFMLLLSRHIAFCDDIDVAHCRTADYTFVFHTLENVGMGIAVEMVLISQFFGKATFTSGQCRFLVAILNLDMISMSRISGDAPVCSPSLKHGFSRWNYFDILPANSLLHMSRKSSLLTYLQFLEMWQVLPAYAGFMSAILNFVV